MTDILPPTYIPLTDAQKRDVEQQPTLQESKEGAELRKTLADLRRLRPDLADKIGA